MAAEHDWMPKAVEWLRAKAAEQRASNERNPVHAQAYPSWTERIKWWMSAAEDLEQQHHRLTYKPPADLEYESWAAPGVAAPAPTERVKSVSDYCAQCLRDAVLTPKGECLAHGVLAAEAELREMREHGNADDATEAAAHLERVRHGSGVGGDAK